MDESARDEVRRVLTMAAVARGTHPGEAIRRLIDFGDLDDDGRVTFCQTGGVRLTAVEALAWSEAIPSRPWPGTEPAKPEPLPDAGPYAGMTSEEVNRLAEQELRGTTWSEPTPPPAPQPVVGKTYAEMSDDELRQQTIYELEQQRRNGQVAR